VTDEEIPPGGTVVANPRWDPWRPEEAARLLVGVGLARVHPGHPWFGATAGSS
jgi:hypothetical protein